MSARCHHPDCGLPQGECASRDCLLLSLHRIDTATIKFGEVVKVAPAIETSRSAECDLPIQFAEPEPLVDRILCAFRLYRLYRAANRPIRESMRNAWRSISN